MKENKAGTIISVVIMMLQIVAEGVAVACLLRLDMLPQKYMLLLLGAFGVLTAVTAILMFLRGGKPVGLTRRIVAWILAILTICGCVFLSVVISKLQQTMDTITGQPVATDTRGVYVMAEDPAVSITDAAGYQFGIVAGYDEECTQKALEVIQQEIGAPVKTVSFETVLGMVDALYTTEDMAVILNEAYLSILEEYPGYGDFSQKTRLLYEAVLETPQTEQPTTVPEPTVPPPEPPSVTNTPFIVYLSGSDTRSKLLSRSRSDVNILAMVNPETHQVLLLNTPRDYYVANPAGGGRMDKLTHCGIYGIDCSIEALENLYGVSVDYYAQINFTGFKTLIDAVGGVTVVADENFSSGGIQVRKGENTFNGKEALIFARERYRVSGGDNGRGKNQMKVITAVLQKLTSGTTVISNYSQILQSLEGMFITSFPMENVSKLVKLQLDEMPAWEIYSFAVTGRTGSDVNYSQPGTKSSVMYQDEVLVNYASTLAKRLLDGEYLTKADMTPPAR